LIRGKRIIVIEDSIVRGSTSRQRIATLKEAGAREVHMRVSSPPHVFPCYYGIDFLTRRELIASDKSTEEIKKYLGLDSLKYITIDGLKNSITPPGENYCFACFNGNYPVFPRGEEKIVLEEKPAINQC
ncbi:MAG TPA: amidophosphoribosyltransferase, partial [Candidatus Atribacteria bacterium]|nr:amidophosphoribosyltransferase [Candidatus Atribacteria bacterium]